MGQSSWALGQLLEAGCSAVGEAGRRVRMGPSHLLGPLFPSREAPGLLLLPSAGGLPARIPALRAGEPRSGTWAWLVPAPAPAGLLHRAAPFLSFPSEALCARTGERATPDEQVRIRRESEGATMRFSRTRAHARRLAGSLQALQAGQATLAGRAVR